MECQCKRGAVAAQCQRPHLHTGPDPGIKSHGGGRHRGRGGVPHVVRALLLQPDAVSAVRDVLPERSRQRQGRGIEAHRLQYVHVERQPRFGGLVQHRSVLHHPGLDDLSAGPRADRRGDRPDHAAGLYVRTGRARHRSDHVRADRGWHGRRSHQHADPDSGQPADRRRARHEGRSRRGLVAAGFSRLHSEFRRVAGGFHRHARLDRQRQLSPQRADYRQYGSLGGQATDHDANLAAQGAGRRIGGS